ncbi:MAG: crossover junction endodeoxyribonuclease RuvC [Chloroflexi bacterium]|nr:crossover junction endodeoxyribonuclease RuvC [Chloroflexota bacterium]
MARILGVDPGLTATGWGLLEIASDGTARLRWNTIQAPDGPLSDRLTYINRQIQDVINRHQPDEFAIERPFVHKNVRTAVMLGQAQAAAMIAAASAGMTVHEYPPRQVKEAVTGLGSAEKTAVKDALVARLGLSEIDASADAADALAVAYCHYLMTGANAALELT